MHAYGKLGFNKISKAMQWEKNTFWTNYTRATECKKMNFSPYFVLSLIKN
jgi:hypothetical protein